MHYAIFFMSDKGRVKACRHVEAEDDGRVLALARSLRHRHRLDVWRGTKHVATLPDQPST
jgi:hypothetical protein